MKKAPRCVAFALRVQQCSATVAIRIAGLHAFRAVPGVLRALRRRSDSSSSKMGMSSAISVAWRRQLRKGGARNVVCAQGTRGVRGRDGFRASATHRRLGSSSAFARSLR
jgi:hypothetical protein